ncbi:MAG TPA: ParA family partition ATPase [Alphaproteobacteria bacterium]|nr:ParA family partition ATPase [Alphaproteobacteria bacterium]
MGAVITVAQQKGGAGKTTLVAHLAVAFRQAGRSVATIDIDPQGSLTRWQEARAERLNGATAIPHSRINGWRAAGEVEKLARAHDLVLVDSPPHMETEARIAVRAARLVIVPVQPSPMDFWATRPTLDMAAAEKVPAILVLNRVPPRARLADDLIARIAELGAPVADSRIGNRTAFAGALLVGLGVSEAARRTQAAEEIEALAAEILSRIG